MKDEWYRTETKAIFNLADVVWFNEYKEHSGTDIVAEVLVSRNDTTKVFQLTRLDYAALLVKFEVKELVSQDFLESVKRHNVLKSLN